jgi:hypothetical protein
MLNTFDENLNPSFFISDRVSRLKQTEDDELIKEVFMEIQ